MSPGGRNAGGAVRKGTKAGREDGVGKPNGPARVRRLLEFRMKIHLPQLVSELELSANESPTPGESLGSLPSRGANFRMVADFTQASEGQITINSPFVQTLIVGGRIPKLNQGVSKPVQRTRHPIHDVIRWQKSLDEGKVRNRAELAKKLGITRAAVTRNLHLIELIPEIRNLLLELRKSEEIRDFSLNRMRRLAQMAPEKQREWLSGIGI